MGQPVQMQMGIESGEVVEIEATATATPSTAPPAWPTWPAPTRSSRRSACATRCPRQQRKLRSLGPMYLRGKQEVTEIFRVDWQPQRDVEAP
jgi:hypothetical protein